MTEVRASARISRRVMNLSHFLRQQARRNQNRLALIWGAHHWTWGTLNARVDAMAAALNSRGIRKGDRVMLHSRNCNQMFESMFACFRLGAVWVPANWRLSPKEVADMARVSGAVAMIGDGTLREHMQAVVNGAPNIKVRIVIGPHSAPEPTYEACVSEYMGSTCDDADVEHDDPCWFFFTSGTTGTPKAAVLTHGQMAFVVTNHIADLMPGLDSSDVSLVVAPLSHGAGVHQLVQVARGCATVLLSKDKLDPEEVWSLVERWRVSNLFAVPTIVKRITEHEAVDRYDHSSLRYLVYAGAPMYRQDQRRALKKLGPVLVQYFGLGEVTGNITVLPRELHDFEDRSGVPIGSCGYERTGMQIIICDNDGHAVKAGETGEICVCGPAVFAGYFNNPEANALAFRDGWFRTGDLGHLDEQGYLYITGRLTDMFISGGSNIYPREIEEQILEHPAISEVVVIGVPDPDWGELGVAIAVRREGIPCDQVSVLGFLEGKLAKYKMPRRVLFWDQLPKTAYGKVSKRALRELVTSGTTIGPDGQLATSMMTIDKGPSH